MSKELNPNQFCCRDIYRANTTKDGNILLYNKEVFIILGGPKDLIGEKLNRNTNKFPDRFDNAREYKKIDYCPFCGKVMSKEII